MAAPSEATPAAPRGSTRSDARSEFSVVTWNVNGLRACAKNGFLRWFESEAADVVCLQEIKASPEQLDPSLRNPLGYHAFWHPAQKPGYSGVAVLTRREPDRVGVGLGIEAFDREGRVLEVEFGGRVVVCAYFPNSQRDHARLPFKLEFCEAISRRLAQLRSQGKHVVLCGDFNIAHRPIDLRNPKANENNAGFLPQERAWMESLLGAGYVDAFRRFEEGPGHYTWWSYRPGVREKNIGWRLDTHLVNAEAVDQLVGSRIQAEVLGSDHCPVRLEMRGL
jgi:exodeoxyribonuclease-3